MSALTFSLKAAPARRLDLSPLTPDRLRDLKQKEILGLALETEAEPLLVDDVFEVKGRDAAEIRFEGGSARFDLIGHAMSSVAAMPSCMRKIHRRRRPKRSLENVSTNGPAIHLNAHGR